jgi:hypothetical protein
MNIYGRDRWAICVGCGGTAAEGGHVIFGIWPLEEVHGPPGKADFYSNQLKQKL